jgi:hypothetical protein
MICQKKAKNHIIYIIRRKNVGHRPFKKVIGQNIEFYAKFLEKQFRLRFKIRCSIWEIISTTLTEYSVCISSSLSYLYHVYY